MVAVDEEYTEVERVLTAKGMETDYATIKQKLFGICQVMIDHTSVADYRKDRDTIINKPGFYLKRK